MMTQIFEIITKILFPYCIIIYTTFTFHVNLTYSMHIQLYRQVCCTWNAFYTNNVDDVYIYQKEI